MRKIFLISFIAAVLAAMMAPPAQAGGILDILSGKNRNSGTLIRSGFRYMETRERERERTRQERIRNQAFVARERLRLERDVGVEKLRSQTDVRRAELRLEERKLQLQAELAKTRSKYRVKRLESQLQAVDAALNSVRKKGVQIRLADRPGETATVQVAGSPEPAVQIADRSRRRYSGYNRRTAKPAALSARDLKVLRQAHTPKRVYGPDEAKIRGYKVYSGKNLVALTAVEINGRTVYWVLKEHVK